MRFVAALGEIEMKLAHLTFTLAIISAAAACTAERALSPQPSATSVASSVGPTMLQVPLLYIVDGVRLDAEAKIERRRANVACLDANRRRQRFADLCR